MQKWEYTVVQADKQSSGNWRQTTHNGYIDEPEATSKPLFEILDVWGDKGWELISRDMLDGRRLEMIFKRPK